MDKIQKLEIRYSTRGASFPGEGVQATTNISDVQLVNKLNELIAAVNVLIAEREEGNS